MGPPLFLRPIAIGVLASVGAVAAITTVRGEEQRRRGSGRDAGLALVPPPLTDPSPLDPAPVDPAPPAPLSAANDDGCLRWMADQGAPIRRAGVLEHVRTPVEVVGPLGGVRLTPRGRRAAIMDCSLARALLEAAPIFKAAGIDELAFSGAYDVRPRRGTNLLSSHAYGLAIDVHAFGGPRRTYDVARDFEKGVGAWRGIQPERGDVAGCIGSASTDAGRTLRTLACRLKHHDAFRVIVTPDDDDDHRDHLHLEAFADGLSRVRGLLGAGPTRPGLTTPRTAARPAYGRAPLP